MNKYFSATTAGFYDFAINGNNIPDGAVPITKAQYIEYKAEAKPPAGKELGADEKGYPAWVDVVLPSAAHRRTTAKDVIDAVAGNARARFVSNGQLVEEEYRLALQQTKDWRTAGSSADAVPASIQGWADADGITAEEAATSIEQTAAGWEIVLLAIRQLRLVGKASVDASDDSADFDAVAKVYIDQLDAMQP